MLVTAPHKSYVYFIYRFRHTDIYRRRLYISFYNLQYFLLMEIRVVPTFYYLKIKMTAASVLYVPPPPPQDKSLAEEFVALRISILCKIEVFGIDRQPASCT